MGEARPAGDDKASEFVLELSVLPLAEVNRPQELVQQPLLVVNEACVRVQAAAEGRGHPDLVEGEQGVVYLCVVDRCIKLGLLA